LDGAWLRTLQYSGVTRRKLAAQVDRAKATLLDLEQLQKCILQDSLGTAMRQMSFELLACPPPPTIKALQPRKAVYAKPILEAAGYEEPYVKESRRQFANFDP
jgi:hypothetical protein